MIDADLRHTVDELEALIDAFGPRLPDTQMLYATPADLRGSSLVVDRRTWLDQDSELFAILVAADRRDDTDLAQRYYDRALDIAHVVASLDVVPSHAELAAISRLRTRLLAGLRHRGAGTDRTIGTEGARAVARARDRDTIRLAGSPPQPTRRGPRRRRTPPSTTRPPGRSRSCWRSSTS